MTQNLYYSIQLLLQGVHKRSVRHRLLHDPGGRADGLRAGLLGAFNDDLMPDRFWDDDFTIELPQEI